MAQGEGERERGSQERWNIIEADGGGSGGEGGGRCMQDWESGSYKKWD